MKAWPVYVILFGLALGLPDGARAHGVIDERLAIADREIATDPDNPKLYLRRGNLHRDHEDWKAAEADYDRAHALWPGLPATAYQRGVLWAKAGKPEKALAYLVDFLSQVPDHAPGYQVRAAVLAELGNYRAAAADYEAAARHFKEPRPQIFLDLVSALEAIIPPDIDRMIAGLNRGIDRLGPIPVLVERALDVEIRAGRHNAARTRLDGLPDPMGRQPAFLFRRAEIARASGDPVEAKAAYQKVLDRILELTERQRQSPLMQKLQARSREALAGL